MTALTQFTFVAGDILPVLANDLMFASKDSIFNSLCTSLYKGGKTKPENYRLSKATINSGIFLPFKNKSDTVSFFNSVMAGLLGNSKELPFLYRFFVDPFNPATYARQKHSGGLIPNTGLPEMNTSLQGESCPQSTKPEDLQNFPALFSIEEVEQLEANTSSIAVNRRFTFMALTRSSDDLKESFMTSDEGREQLLTLFETVTDYREHLKKMLELADCAIARMTVISGVFEETPDNKKPA